MRIFKRDGSPYYYTEFQIQGHRFLRSTRRTTEREAGQEARRIRAEAKAEIEASEAKRPGDPLTLDQAFGKYLVDEVPKLSPTWQAEVKRYQAHILNLVDKDMLVEDATDATVDEYVKAHVADGGGAYALNRSLAVWRRIHNLSRKRWKQRTQEIDWAEFKNAEKKRTSYITLTQAQRLIEVAPSHIAEMIEWTLLTGCRRSETFNLVRTAIYFDEARAVVTAKGGRQHTLWLTADALALLTRLPERGRYVFDRTNWSKHWRASVARAGLDGFRWHDMRHTHATWLRQAGVPLEVVQRSLGHADLATTTRYAHVADREVQQALHQLPSLTTSPTKIVPLRANKTST